MVYREPARNTINRNLQYQLRDRLVNQHLFEEEASVKNSKCSYKKLDTNVAVLPGEVRLVRKRALPKIQIIPIAVEQELNAHKADKRLQVEVRTVKI